MNQKGSPRSPQGEAGFAPILILIGVFIIAVVAGGAYYLGKLSTTSQSTGAQKVSQQGIQPSSTQNPTENWNWKTYEIQKIGFSMKYPPTWTTLEIKYPYPDEETIFNGPEGRITLRLGTGFGGGCPEPITIKISGQELPGCRSGNIDEQYLSISKETDILVDLGKGVQGKLGFQVNTYSAPPGQINQTAILKILSTFKFIE